MAGGGAERVMSILAGGLARLGWEITLVTLSPTGDDAYALDPRVRRVGLDLARDSTTPWRAAMAIVERVRELRRAITRARPEVVLSFGDNMNLLTLAAVGSRLPTVVAERTDPTRHDIGRLRVHWRRRAYPQARFVVVQTHSLQPWAQSIVGRRRAIVIPNPVPRPPPWSEPEFPLPDARPVVSVGRMTRDKGFDLLIDAFAKVASTHNDLSLVIVGDGPLRAELTGQAARLGIADRVRMPGRSRDPSAVVRRATLYVCASRYEGFPNAPAEAMSLGRVVVAADCSAGVRELIRDGVDGLLVPPNDASALADGMLRLLGDPARCTRMGRAAAQVTSRFDVHAIVDRWARLLRLAADR